MTLPLMENWFKVDKVKKNFFYLDLEFDVCGLYYNKNSFAIEPFLEPFPI